jgi:RNA polymerase sigma-70 factor, ECF subfamily
VEFGHDAADVSLDGLRGEVEAVADALIGPAFGHEGEHFAFAVGEPVEGVVEPGPADQGPDDLGVDDGLAAGNSGDRVAERRNVVDSVFAAAGGGPAGVGLGPVIQDIRVRDGPADVAAALRSAQGGDEVGFRVLYRDVQPRLLRYLRVLVAGDAEDVASEAWLQISRDLAAFRGDLDDFRGWATAVARNRALDHLRRQRRRPPTGEPFEALAHVAADQDTAQSAVEAIGTDAALELIAELPPDQAEAVLLRVIIGLDAKVAARVLGKRPGAVRTAAYRGLNRLAERLDQLGVNAPSESTGVTHPSPPTLRKLR